MCTFRLYFSPSILMNDNALTLLSKKAHEIYYGERESQLFTAACGAVSHGLARGRVVVARIGNSSKQ
jgi:hypothetical protein